MTHWTSAPAKAALALCALAFLAGCGVDGAPVRPDPVQVEASRSSGISVGISGTASIGIKGGSRR